MTTGSHIGVDVGVGGQVSSADGSITVVGTGGTGLSNDYGVVFSGTTQATGAGTITVTGVGGSDNSSVGILVNSGVTVSTNAQSISMTSDSMSLAGAISAGTGWSQSNSSQTAPPSTLAVPTSLSVLRKHSV